MTQLRPLFRFGLVCLLGTACSTPTSAPPTTGTLGPGVVFTYPANGQVDVPVGARVSVKLTGAVSAGALTAGCAQDGSGQVTGAFCLVGPEGPVPVSLKASGPSEQLVVAQPSGLRPGTKYQVYVRPALLAGAGGATNLPTDTPLFSFTTRAQSPVAGSPPKLVAVNDDDPRAFLDGSGVSPKMPFLSLTTLRLLFSEPLDERTVVLNSTFFVTRVDSAGQQTAVPGTLLVQGIHLTFDPDQDLDPAATYQVQTMAGVLDRGGEPLAPFTLTLHPKAASDQGQPYPQLLAVSAPATSQSILSTALSDLTGTSDNTVEAQAPLIGDNLMGLLGGTVQAELASPSAFNGPIPFTIRKGQRLDLTAMPIRFDGLLESGYQTGTLHMFILSDATGSMRRNTYRPADAAPDDALSPVSVDMTFDAAMTAEDPNGNAMVTQTVMGFHVVGTALAQDGALIIETMGALELGALGMARASLNATMRLQTAPSASLPPPAPPVKLLATYPAPGQGDVPPDAHIVLTFSQPVDVARLKAGGLTLSDSSGNPVAFSLRLEGSDVVVNPVVWLGYGNGYTVTLNQVVGLSGAPLALSADDPTAGVGSFSFATPVWDTQQVPAPVLLALYPGAPCALTGGTGTGPGHCVGGQAGDDDYLPFTLPANRNIEASFNQPMDVMTFALGSACGEGDIRVEQLDSAGNCLGVVPGTLLTRERGFVFIPNDPWGTGVSYRLTLVGGNDAHCDVGELCSLLEAPLNTHPLNGVSGKGGGPDIVIPFTGADATPETYIPLSASPATDLNGNGYVDADEQLRAENQLAVEILSKGGTITDTSLVGADCMPDRPGVQVCASLAANIPISVEQPIASCPIDMDGNPTTSGAPCVPVRLYASVIANTSLGLNATAAWILSISNNTGMLMLRGREGPAGTMGYILTGADGKPEFVIDEHLYMDAPDMSILWGGVAHDLHSKPLEMVLAGPVTFLPDGRLQVALRSLADVALQVNLSVLGVGAGWVELRIPAGSVHMTIRAPLAQ